MTTYKKYRVDYVTNQGEMKGKNIFVYVEGTDVEDARDRFERTSVILGQGIKNSKAEIKAITLAKTQKTPH